MDQLVSYGKRGGFLGNISLLLLLEYYIFICVIMSYFPPGIVLQKEGKTQAIFCIFDIVNHNVILGKQMKLELKDIEWINNIQFIFNFPFIILHISFSLLFFFFSFFTSSMYPFSSHNCFSFHFLLNGIMVIRFIQPCHQSLHFYSRAWKQLLNFIHNTQWIYHFLRSFSVLVEHNVVHTFRFSLISLFADDFLCSEYARNPCEISV